MKVQPGVIYMARDKSTWIWSGVVGSVGYGTEISNLVRMRNCDTPKLADEWLTVRGKWYLSETVQSDRDLIAVVAA